MSVYDGRDYYIDGRMLNLPTSSYRYVTKGEFKRAIELVLDNNRIALSRIPEVEEIIRKFDGKPAKKKFEEALEEHGFALENGRICMPMTSNCVLSDDGSEIVSWGCFNATMGNLEKGVEMCGFLRFDEEGLLDADRTLARTVLEDNIGTNIKWLEREVAELSSPDRDVWIDKMFEARELLREIGRNAPEELRYRLFEDMLAGAGETN